MSYADDYHKKLDKCFEEEKLQLTACKKTCFNKQDQQEEIECFDMCDKYYNLNCIKAGTRYDCQEWCDEVYFWPYKKAGCKRDCSDTYASFGDTKNTEDIADSLSTQRSPMIDETDIYNSMSI